jgi:hypothetical protein
VFEPNLRQRAALCVPPNKPALATLEATAHPNGGWHQSEIIGLWHNGTRWVDVPSSNPRKRAFVGDTGDTQVVVNVMLAASIALTMRYEASAVVSVGNRCAVRLPATLGSLRYLLRDRERGNFKRRKALLHFVRATLRDQRPVREHLRGAFLCQWRGADVRVLPPAFDMERVGIDLTVPQRLLSDRLAARALSG